MHKVIWGLVAIYVVIGVILWTGAASAAPDLVAFRDARFAPGTIVVHNSERRLYLVQRGGTALRYPVAVGRRGKVWRGRTYIKGMHVRPAWSPPAEVKRDLPHLPAVIPGGARNNPMGVAAMTLAGGEYAIHGTNRPGLIGRAVSYGCIRMNNADIADLFRRVGVRTPVVAIN
ncbi:L,D-transpeptidase [Stappia taiwanensis]|uniref:L,D-transpeptidase n=1 Tax=Stappia taiwanensis TaxID=992267 RepID=A0A838XP74_9HYPH|nr:L,D-transpeptidase [Stappia taiwanensis]MBA4610528.1 L,D-transpeptidase [Stappia taiwanensis]GGE84171.1 L,D-transpeptidase [Stappia taiwanensis]